MEKAYLGIDPGKHGVVALQKNGEWEWHFVSELDCYQLADIFAKIKEENPDIACVIEDVHAIFNSAAKATFSFGENKGMLIGLLCANKIPFTLVPPKQWQATMWTNADKEYDTKMIRNKDGLWVSKKSINTKKTSINAAKRLFPTIDFRRNSKCKNIDDNKVDATLMAEYARRNNL